MDEKLMIAILEEIRENQKETNRKVDDLRQDVKSDLVQVRHEQKEMQREIAAGNHIQIKQQIILEEHMKRTLQNEEALDVFKEYNDKALSAVKSDIAPMKTFMAMWSGAAKVLTVVGAITAIVGVIYKYFIH